jgi:hypothetical protein
MSRTTILLAAAAGSVLVGGALIAVTWHVPFGHGLFCSLGTAATVGCDVAPRGGAGQVIAAAVMLTAIPLLAAAFGQLHLDKVREHVDTRLGEHHRAIHERLDRIEHKASD